METNASNQEPIVTSNLHQKINDEQINHLVDALSTSLSAIQGMRGKLIDHYTYQEKLAIANKIVHSHSQRISDLEKQVQSQQSIIDQQRKQLADREYEYGELLTKFQEIIESLRQEIDQLKSYIWSQKQTIKGYEQQLVSQWTNSNMAIAAKNYQLELAQAEVLAQRDLSGCLDIQFQAAEGKFNALIDYLGGSPLHCKSTDERAAQWQELRTEMANLQARIDYQSYHINLSRQQINNWQQDWHNPYDRNENQPPITNCLSSKRSPTANLTILKSTNHHTPKKLDIPRFSH